MMLWLKMAGLFVFGFLLGSLFSVCKRPSLSSEKKPTGIPREYLTGLNYLLSEQPDRAVDIFIRLIKVDTETIETHLALGGLFRRRGEVDRAIRIHQNLIARPQLSRAQRNDALLALAQDYLSAGVLDRAERLFQEVVETNGEQTKIALSFLIGIYEREKSWAMAIEMASRMESFFGNEMHTNIAHYHCELGDEACDKGLFEEAVRYYKKALSVDRLCVRSNLSLGKVAFKQKQYKPALKWLKQVEMQDPDYVSEAIEPLVICHQEMGQELELYDYLQTCLKDHPRISIVLVLANLLKKMKGHKIAADFVVEQMRIYPSIKALKCLISLQLHDAEAALWDNLTVLYHLTELLLENKPNYRCRQCGFNSKNLYWLCPSCHHWSTVRPIYGVEGD